jgi:Alpha/beta hydrolase domain
MPALKLIGKGRLLLRPKTTFLTLVFAGFITSCGGGSLSVGTPGIPAARSALVPPELTVACAIADSSIDSLVTKGTGLAFNGASFGPVGTYTYYLSEATAKVSSKDSCAATIVDLKNAVDSNGNVSYKFDVIIITPTDATKANGTLLYEVNNRTNTPSFAALQDGNGQDLFTNVKPEITGAASGGVTTGTGAGNGFLLSQGTTVVWSGWQGDRPQTLTVATAAITATTKWYAPGMSLPIAVNVASSGAKITGGVQDEFIADNATSNLLGTYYSMAAGTEPNATLTIRKTALDTPITVDRSLWTYKAGTGTAEGGNTGATGYGYVTIDRAGVRASSSYTAALDAASDNGSIYHFNYTAVDPKPFGLGFLGVRDLVSFLRNDTKDAAGNANPLAGRIKFTLATGISQSGRYLRDFLWQGFNADKTKKRVFDGMLPLVGGSRKTYTNYRWAKPGDYSRQHETHFTPGDQFPFGYATLTDPVSGKTDGLLKKCTENNTCPKVFQYDSPIEFNGARASLTVTDGAGKDVAIPSNVRMFYAPGTSHGPQQLANNANLQPDYSVDRTAATTAASLSAGALNASTALYRALLLNLEGWVKGTITTPLASNFPSVTAGTMAVPTALPASLGAPDLAAIGLGFNGGYNTLTLNDETAVPTKPSTQAYVVHQPTTDAQGNDRGGIKMPDFAVPLATFKGYSLRKSGFAAGMQNSLSSSQLAFGLTNASKKVGDPRRSIEDLYVNKVGYVAKANAAIDSLVAEGFMLADDAAMYKNRVTMQSLQPNFALLP